MQTVLAFVFLFLSTQSFGTSSKIVDPEGIFPLAEREQAQSHLRKIEKLFGHSVLLRVGTAVKADSQYDLAVYFLPSEKPEIVVHSQLLEVNTRDKRYIVQEAMLPFKVHAYELVLSSAVPAVYQVFNRIQGKQIADVPLWARTLGYLLLIFSLGAIASLLGKPSLSSSLSFHPLTLLGGLFFSWVLLNFDLYLHPKVYLPRDNYELNYAMFAYVANFLRHFDQLPHWFYSKEGGVWFEVLSNCFLSVFPTHWVGWVVAKIFPLSLNSLWKFCFLILGQSLFLVGIYLLAKIVFQSVRAAVLTVAIAIFSPLNTSILHQEQAQATFLFVPYFWICFLKIRKEPLYWAILGSVIGFSLNFHYPQHQVVYLGICFLGAVLFPSGRRYVRQILVTSSWPRTFAYGTLGIIGFVSASSPLFFSYFKYRDQLSSPLRKQQSDIGVKTFEQYQNIDGIASTSVVPGELLLYVQGQEKALRYIRHLDNRYYSMTVAIPLLLLILCILPVPFKGLQVFLLLSVAFTSLGVHSFVPRLLWSILPGIELFRQWFHFTAFINLHLLFLLVFGLIALFDAQLSASQKRLFSLGALAFGILWLKGWLPVAFSLGAAAILLVKLKWQTKKVTPALACLWILGAAYLYASETAHEYRYWGIFRNDPFLQAKTPDKFAETLIWDGFPILQLAQPKQLQVEFLAKRPVNLVWRMQDSWRLVLEDQARVSWSQGSLTIDPNPPDGASALAFIQYDDGNWNSDAILLKNSASVLMFPAQQSVRLGRSPTFWWWWVGVSWIPMLAIVSFLVKRLFSALTGKPIISWPIGLLGKKA